MPARRRSSCTASTAMHNIYFTLPQTHVVAHGEDPRLLRVFSQPAAAAQPSQADHERNAVRHHPAHAGPGGRLRQPRRRGGVHHSARAAGAQQHAHHRVHRPLHAWSAKTRPTPRCGRAFIAIPYLDIRGDLLPLADDLKQLPHAVSRSGGDSAAQHSRGLSPRTPSYKAIQAAGIVTSYFGMISENRPVRFPVHIGAIPPGNAIVIADNAGKSARRA